MKQADEEPVEPGVEVPVEKAQIVADDIVAIVGELDALALALAARLALHAAEEDLAQTSSSCSSRAGTAGPAVT